MLKSLINFVKNSTKDSRDILGIRIQEHSLVCAKGCISEGSLILGECFEIKAPSGMSLYSKSGKEKVFLQMMKRAIKKAETKNVYISKDSFSHRSEVFVPRESMKNVKDLEAHLLHTVREKTSGRMRERICEYHIKSHRDHGAWVRVSVMSEDLVQNYKDIVKESGGKLIGCSDGAEGLCKIIQNRGASLLLNISSFGLEASVCFGAHVLWHESAHFDFEESIRSLSKKRSWSLSKTREMIEFCGLEKGGPDTMLEKQIRQEFFKLEVFLRKTIERVSTLDKRVSSVTLYGDLALTVGLRDFVREQTRLHVSCIAPWEHSRIKVGEKLLRSDAILYAAGYCAFGEVLDEISRGK